MPPALQNEEVVVDVQDPGQFTKEELAIALMQSTKQCNELLARDRERDASYERHSRLITLLMEQVRELNAREANRVPAPARGGAIAPEGAELTPTQIQKFVALIESVMKRHFRAQPVQGWSAWLKSSLKGAACSMPLFYVLRFIANWAYSYVIATPMGIATIAAVSTGLGYLVGSGLLPWVIGAAAVVAVVGGTIYYMSDTSDTKEKIS